MGTFLENVAFLMYFFEEGIYRKSKTASQKVISENWCNQPVVISDTASNLSDKFCIAKFS